MKFIRLDEDHFAYLASRDLSMDSVAIIRHAFAEFWPGKQIVVIRADEFIARPGEYEVVRADEEPTGHMTQQGWDGAKALARSILTSGMGAVDRPRWWHFGKRRGE